MNKQAWLLTAAILSGAASSAGAQAAPGSEHFFRRSLADLGLAPVQLAYSDRVDQHVEFSARADHVLTAAELALGFDPALAEAAFDRMDVLLNGQLVDTIVATGLRKSGGQRQVVFDPALLRRDNELTLWLHGASARAGCRVAAGTWSALRSATLDMRSSKLPQQSDLGELPLPFLDPTFDREPSLHFVWLNPPSGGQLKAAGVVAGWFSLQARGRRLSFAAHLGELPVRDAVVFVSGAEAARSWGLGLPGDLANSSLLVRNHPRAPEHKLLVVYGADDTALLAAANALARDGARLHGARAEYRGPVELPPLERGEVPRWVSGSEVVLGRLPDAPPLALRGGHSGDLELPFRLAPDLFVWPRERVELELGFDQAFTPDRGPAELYVTLNEHALGKLPKAAHGRAIMPVPRELLRGKNELSVHVAYEGVRTAAAEGGGTDACSSTGDPGSWVALAADSRLRLGAVAHYAPWPDLRLFLADGFPFTVQADLRDSSVLLPADPDASEVASALGFFAHFAVVTGHVASAVDVRLGHVQLSDLRGRDVLTVASAGRHPLLQTYADALPLRLAASGASAQRPRASLLARLLAADVASAELGRAQQLVSGGAFGAVYALAAPWDTRRAWLVVSASDRGSLPLAAALQQVHADGPGDLLIQRAGVRQLFQLGAVSGRGNLGPRVWLRHSLARAWMLLAALALGASLLAAVWLRPRLVEQARRRLQGSEL